MGEQQHVANARLVRKEHNYTVNADTDAARRRHAVLKSTDVVGVILHGLVIARSLFLHLLLEALCLVNRVIQLAKGIGVLMACNNKLKTIGQTRVVLEALG